MTDQVTNEAEPEIDLAAVDDTTGTDAIVDSPTEFSYKEDRSDWNPPHRLGEVTSERNDARRAAELANDKATWLQDQLNQSRAAPAAEESPPEINTDELYNSLKDAVDEGRGEDVASIQRQISAADSANMKAYMKEQMSDSGKQVAQQVGAQQQEAEFQRELKQTLADHPEFDDNTQEYDKPLAARVMRLMRGFHADGANKVDAMREAIEVAGVTKKKSFGDIDRAAGERTKNARQSREQAPDMTTVGNRAHVESTVDVSKMTRKQFREFQKDSVAMKKARGDGG